MKLHADLTQRAVVYSETLPWVDSPAPGVQRRMLERDGDEVARATSLVRYAPGSSFPTHTHGGGEEYLVLSGVFSDDRGDYGAGSYVRNPVGSQHAPHSHEGSIILVKLWQMDPGDRSQVAIDTNIATWQSGQTDGIQILPLHRYRTEEVRLERWRSDTKLASQTHPHGWEIFVLDGALEDEQGRYPKGTWLRLPPGSSNTPLSHEGTLLYVKTGHLSGNA